MAELLRKHGYLSGGKQGMSSCERKAEKFPVVCITEQLKICNAAQISSCHFLETQHGRLHRESFPRRKSPSSQNAGMIRRID